MHNSRGKIRLEEKASMGKSAQLLEEEIKLEVKPPQALMLNNSTVDFFVKLGSSMKFIPILAFYLNHRQLQLHLKQFVAVTKITRRNTMHKYTRSILGNPSQQGKKTQPILYYILQEKDLPHHKPSTQKGAHKT
jgi:hypothetical protein